ncbi:MAG: Bax inhibitor-1/YccA family protein [Proteobacteria bacterium]|nr:Bax inhibitor-1/YccA family protein [Pseudomonadota bacterium]
MPTKKSVKSVPVATNTPAQADLSRHSVAQADGGMGVYLKRIFALMFGALALTAISSFATLQWGLPLVFNSDFTNYSGLFYVVMFGGLFLSIFAQARAFKMRPAMGGLLLAIYAIAMGFVISPLVAFALGANPASVLLAFILTAIMFACMALFGYRTTKNLGFLGTFLFIGMIGLVLAGIAGMFFHALLGGMFGIIVCVVGVLIFALFTAYDMQFLKKAYAAGGDDTTKNQLAVLGALHLYISFIAMFQYILSLLNRR